MNVKEIYPNLFLYTFPNQYELASTFIRLQEFYESPYKEIKGKYFELDQYMDLYVKDQKDNKFTYFEDWNGFNVPGNIIQEFKDKFEEHFTNKEYDLFQSLRKSGKTYDKSWKGCKKIHKEKYYIIAVVDKGKDTIQHEIAHGLYYLNKDYKREMNKLIKQMLLPLRSRAEIYLKKTGYCKAVLKDELQAYFATGLDKGMSSIWCKLIYWSYINKIKRLFKIYGIFAILNARG